MSDNINRTISDATESGIRFTNVSKVFGKVIALTDISMAIHGKEIVGIAGHNGAGKSTLIKLIMGVHKPNTGQILAFDHQLNSSADAHRAGIRCVFQELSLCPNLTAVENTGLLHKTKNIIGWRKSVEQMLRLKMDEIFPGNKISLNIPIEALSLAERQMVEIARAFTETEHRVKLMILDEPTSSLGAGPTKQLMAHMLREAKRGIAFIFVTHRLNEILEVSTRTLVMIDGSVVKDMPSDGLTQDMIIAEMGQLELENETASGDETVIVKNTLKFSKKRVIEPLDVSASPYVELSLHSGEIVGVAGLDGHGQKNLLEAVFKASLGSIKQGIKVDPKTSYVAGDRQEDGVFPLWNIGQNLGISWCLERFGSRLIQPLEESKIIQKWMKKMAVRSPNSNLPILSLSGGNQQKVLFGRSLAGNSSLVILDDPMRGVDVGTKRDVYQLIQSQAQEGRAFLWYATETAELLQCGRVFVMNEGRIVKELVGKEISEESIVAASFLSKPELLRRT